MVLIKNEFTCKQEPFLLKYTILFDLWLVLSPKSFHLPSWPGFLFIKRKKNKFTLKSLPESKKKCRRDVNKAKYDIQNKLNRYDIDKSNRVGDETEKRERKREEEREKERQEIFLGAKASGAKSMTKESDRRVRSKTAREAPKKMNTLPTDRQTNTVG